MQDTDSKPDNGGNEVKDSDDDDETAELSDLRNPQRHIFVVTTAALPWRTGTAVNPFLRALYLTRGRPKGHVTLVIPWLQDPSTQKKLYGQSFETQEEQEQWIRAYARERAQCEREEEAMNIIFYHAVYHESFGSIFPSVDICGLIPEHEADVAILEEPEHLNWFRVPDKEKSVALVKTATSSETLDPVTESKIFASDGEKSERTPDTDRKDLEESVSNTVSTESTEQNRRVIEELGWAHKFEFVVGILHTNYSAYMRQYAVGTSMIAAPAITVLSSIVVKAYCHKVIRLSAVLPSLAAELEVTCNVHGVRKEFLQVSDCNTRDVELAIESRNEGSAKDGDEQVPASVYFIGKLIWAKGFDKLLTIQNLYHKATGDYFPIDIYGTGADEKAITRAFFGRGGSQQNNKPPSRETSDSCAEVPVSSTDARAADIFSSQVSLRDHIYTVERSASGLNEGFEVAPCVADPLQLVGSNENSSEENAASNPLTMVGDVSRTTLGTATLTSHAIYKLAGVLFCHGLFMATTWDENDGDNVSCNGSSFNFDPPQSLHEWRRQPVPARFLGVKDHALLKDLPEHKIFLNASVTEVLCTTTAEALAMGKFVIIPRHSSNEFFLQFPNCLAYDSPADCVTKLQFALSNQPTPLLPEYSHRLDWEGAIERLFDAARLSKREMRERNQNGNANIARLLVEFGKTSQLIGSIFSASAARDKPG